MEFLVNVFNILLYQPLFNTLILLHQLIPGQDFGIAIIFLALLIKFLFYPLTAKAIKSQRTLIELQPKIQEIQQKFKEDKEKQVKEIINLYQKEKVNPFSGLLPMLIQLPVLIALFQIFIKGFSPEQMIHLYDFIPQPEAINLVSFGIIDLKKPDIIIAILTGIAQFFQSKMLIPKIKKINKKEDQMTQISRMVQKQMVYFVPIFTFFILLTIPSAMGLYWLVTTLFSIGEQRLILKSLKQQNAKFRNNKKNN
jgi:YidC/Oxa1 family membrane protein insertase